MDPIFMDPEYKFIKAHFYSPQKQVLGNYFDTFIINVVVLWVMTVLLYLALYFRLLKKFLDSGAAITGKRKGSDHS
jgi:ABC transport system ATP-binding/permease protein